MTMTDRYAPRHALPDPYDREDLYRDIPTKRLIAWVFDVVMIGVITLALSFASIFTLPLLLPLFLIISFFYRWWALAARSATPGMRFTSIEILSRDGYKLDGTTAFLHTAGYTFSVVTFPVQLVSIVLMLMTARKQGLTDLVLGTAAVNRRVG